MHGKDVNQTNSSAQGFLPSCVIYSQTKSLAEVVQRTRAIPMWISLAVAIQISSRSPYTPVHSVNRIVLGFKAKGGDPSCRQASALLIADPCSDGTGGPAPPYTLPPIPEKCLTSCRVLEKGLNFRSENQATCVHSRAGTRAEVPLQRCFTRV